MGRPRTPFNWTEFDKLCAFQCTAEEIAAWFHCDTDTVTNAVKREKGCTFSEYFSTKKAAGRVPLRRKQMQVALGGNVAMLIWLGKQLLSQTDKLQHVDPLSAKSELAKLLQIEPSNLPD